jgi:hypothetical protein
VISRGPKPSLLRAVGTCLLLVITVLSLWCRRSADRETAATRQARRSSEYWQQVIGVTDPAQLQQIQALERKQSGRYRQSQTEIRRYRNELKLRANRDQLTESVRDSLVEIIVRLTAVQEKAGIEGWREINRFLTPEQRAARAAEIQSSDPGTTPGAGDSTRLTNGPAEK